VCGIVGLFAKRPAIEGQLGAHLGRMLVEMSDRGPDSAGFAVYRDPVAAGGSKLTVLSHEPGYAFDALAAALAERLPAPPRVVPRGNHAVITAPCEAARVREALDAVDANLRVTSSGTTIEIYKEKGRPADVVRRFAVAAMRGTHALGHTRMATESAVTTEHSHPFSTGEDLCLVHNGSLSNHNTLRTDLERQGIRFATDNDSEVAAGYLTWRLREGDSLEQALERALADLDGFYTFAIGTRDGFAVLRDPIACKPAVIAECDDWVAIASEYRAIAVLPRADQAQCWEPAPARIYTWSH
jgi:amidophosphoribosyltransferase